MARATSLRGALESGRVLTRNWAPTCSTASISLHSCRGAGRRSADARESSQAHLISGRGEKRGEGNGRRKARARGGGLWMRRALLPFSLPSRRTCKRASAPGSLFQGMSASRPASWSRLVSYCVRASLSMRQAAAALKISPRAFTASSLYSAGAAATRASAAREIAFGRAVG